MPTKGRRARNTTMPITPAMTAAGLHLITLAENVRRLGGSFEAMEDGSFVVEGPSEAREAIQKLLNAALKGE